MTSPVADAWRTILAEGRTEAGWHARRVHGTAATPIQAALRLPGPRKGLLLQVAARSIHPSNRFPSSSGFDVTLEPLVPGPNGSVRICLELTDPRFEDVFAVLADDVAAAVSAAGSEPAGIAALIGRLNTWQRFLKRHGGGVLAEHERIGLFAELTMLRDLLDDGLSAGDAVDAWRGPWGGAQDFRLATCSVEIKATASASSASFEVSNLAQLDERLLPCLIVRHIALSRPNGRGETLPELVDAVAAAITATDPAASLRFSDSLLEVGYLDVHRPEYEHERLAVFSDRLFRVRGGFPRILADDVRPGVSACSYAVQLSACLPFLIDGDSARRIIHGERDE